MHKTMIALTGGVLIVALAMAAEDKASSKAEHASDARTRPAEIGKPAPDFELTSTDGKTHKLSDYQDKVVVIEWFHMECPFVKGAAEMVAETSSKYAEKGVVWLAIDSTAKDHGQYRTPAQINEYRKKHDIKYPILKDPDGNVGKTYRAQTTPHIYIVDKGELVYVGGHSNVKGAQPGDRNYIAETLDALLADKPVPNQRTQNRGCSVKYAK